MGPDGAYEVRARIRARSGRGGRAVAVLVVVAIIGWAGYVGADRLGVLGSSARPVASAVSTASPAPASPIVGPPASPLPAVQAFAPLADRETFPAILDGLEWVNPGTGLASHARGPDGPLDSAGWWFQLGGGATLCACLVYPLARQPGTLMVERFGTSGDEQAATDYPGFSPPADQWEAMDVVLDPGATSLITAAATWTEGRWRLHLRRLPLVPGATAADRTIDLGPVGGLGPMAGVDPPEVVGLRLFVAPDGRHVLVSLQEPRDVVPGRGAEWLVDLASGGFGQARLDPFGSDARDADACARAGWASATRFVDICSAEEAPDPRQPNHWAVGLQDAGRTTTWLSLDPPADTGWIVDATHAAVYGWGPTPHEIVRVDAATGAWSSLQLGLPVLLGQTVDGAMPPLGADVVWAPTQSASQPDELPIAGSPDGRLVYGLGTVVDDVFGIPESDGIWAIDTTSLAFVAHWQPLASYGALGLTPDGRALIGVGPPEGTPGTTAGDLILGLQDARDGSPIAVVRDIGDRLGGIPGLLAPGPPGR